MVAGDVVHPDQEVVHLQADAQNLEEHSRGSTSRRSRWTSGELVWMPTGEPSALGRWSGVRRRFFEQMRRRDNTDLES